MTPDRDETADRAEPDPQPPPGPGPAEPATSPGPATGPGADTAPRTGTAPGEDTDPEPEPDTASASTHTGRSSPAPEADPAAATTAPAQRRPRQQRKQVLLRLDPAVHDALAAWAAAELRSTNAQIEFLLRRALFDAGRLPTTVRPIPKRGRPPKSGTGDGGPAPTPDTGPD